METVARNAQQALVLHKTKRASDLTTRSRALEEIAEALDLDCAPLRIECYDISHLQGDDVVASMVVFEDGLARKSEYRRFQIKGFDGQDDVRSMHEVDQPPLPALPPEKGRTGEWGGEGDVARRGRVARSPRRRGKFNPKTGRRPDLTFFLGGRPPPSASPIRPSSSSWTAANRRSRPPSGPWTSSASTTSRCAASPSASKRSGCRATTTR